VATYEHRLAKPPRGSRARELWMQHAAGFILFEDVRRYAIEQIDSSLPMKARKAAEKGINDAVYGMMMVIDGVTGGLSDAKHKLQIDFLVRLIKCADSKQGDTVVAEVDLGNGDGMCMGFHGWLEGDFGEDPVAVPKASSTQ